MMETPEIGWGGDQGSDDEHEVESLLTSDESRSREDLPRKTGLSKEITSRAIPVLLLLLATSIVFFSVGRYASHRSYETTSSDIQTKRTDPLSIEEEHVAPTQYPAGSLGNLDTTDRPFQSVAPTQAPTSKAALTATSAPVETINDAASLDDEDSTDSPFPSVAPTVAPTNKKATQTPTGTITPSTGTASVDDTTHDEGPLLDDDSLFVPHLPFGEDLLQYRRICAPVHSSILCLTLRFPFAVAVQDANYSYPRPVDDRFYDLDKEGRFIDGDYLHRCRNDTAALSMDRGVQACLDWYATIQPNNTVVSVWTRRRQNSTVTDFYGVRMSPKQGKRIDKFFDKHIILVMGASPAPAVTTCMLELFGGCINGGIKPVSQLCEGHNDPESRMLGNKYTINQLPLNQTYIGVFGYYPTAQSHGRRHSLPNQNLTGLLNSTVGFAREPGFKELRKLTLIIEYPIAHAQNQNMIFEEMDKVETIQKGFPKLITNAQLEDGRRELAEIGYELAHIIAFDGIPQFFPTVTGAYDWALKSKPTEANFLELKGYPDWKPEYGSKCRGPLPPSSKLTSVNGISRTSFEDNGLDMRFYGRTWEFGNQFWWHVQRWKTGKKAGLDCLHSHAGR
jgi:hypothetical protein